MSATVQQVAAGSVVIDGNLAPLLSGGEPSHTVGGTQLSAREQEILALVAAGFRNAVIAGKLVITERAVEKHLNAIYRKLGLNHNGQQHPRVSATRFYLDRNGFHVDRHGPESQEERSIRMSPQTLVPGDEQVPTSW